ncbi:hypothetical protein AB1Y20_020744 [Prymnesium parvum]|uniref:Uncharacterized protein n=1 Tax=Prymnesium parvum TaxID=97485 RepID=A0AB34JYI0_PRYPA
MPPPCAALPAVRYELVTGALSRFGAAATLAPQHLRRLDPHAEHAASLRPIPLAPPPSVDAARLAWEFNETAAFRSRQLRADPRLQPHDITPSFAHLRGCSSCAQRDATRAALAAAPPPSPRGWHSLVDDYSVAFHTNVARSLSPPTARRAVFSPRRPRHEARFGCPCSVWPPRGNRSGYRLYHAAGRMAGGGFRYTEWPREMRAATSADGVAWREGAPLTLDGGGEGMTGTFTAAEGGGRHLAGYEGANSKACLAASSDGIAWATLPTGASVGPTSPHATPPHLLRARFNLRADPTASRACAPPIHACASNGSKWGGGVMMDCLLRALRAGGVTHAACAAALRAYAAARAVDCADGSASRLGRAADAYVQPMEAAGRQLVWFRRDYGGPGGWREIRGVQVVEVHGGVGGDLRKARLEGVGGYYLDRLGKLERFRRQIYTLTFTRRSATLWLGLMTVIEWAKDLSEPAAPHLPAFARDTTNVYLVTSRDGVHVDDGWVYAHAPLLPKGRTQAAWDSGFLLPAAQLLAAPRGGGTRLYYEARRVRHEQRFRGAAAIGMAAWDDDRLAALRAADPSLPAAVEARPLRAASRRMALLVSLGAPPRCGGALRVEARLGTRGGAPLAVGVVALPPRGRRRGGRERVVWEAAAGGGAALRVTPNASVYLRFGLEGAVQLYAFRLLWLAA